MVEEAVRQEGIRHRGEEEDGGQAKSRSAPGRPTPGIDDDESNKGDEPNGVDAVRPLEGRVEELDGRGLVEKGLGDGVRRGAKRREGKQKVYLGPGLSRIDERVGQAHGYKRASGDELGDDEWTH